VVYRVDALNAPMRLYVWSDNIACKHVFGPKPNMVWTQHHLYPRAKERAEVCRR
jgi:hypothetical protein